MKTKTVYQANTANRLYLFPIEANELPFSKGHFNIPFMAFEDEPPVAPAGHAVQRNQALTGWDIVEDHLSDTLYFIGTDQIYAIGSEALINDEPQFYSGLGSLPAWLTLVKTEPAPAPDQPQDESEAPADEATAS
jgi:hypothetical protein